MTLIVDQTAVARVDAVRLRSNAQARVRMRHMRRVRRIRYAAAVLAFVVLYAAGYACAGMLGVLLVFAATAIPLVALLCA